MSLSSFDILETDGVLIIGLVILLSFQSVTSSFVENDIQTFFSDLRDMYIEQEEVDLILIDCHDYEKNPEEFINRIKEYYTLDLSRYDVSRDEVVPLVSNVGDEFLDIFKQKCIDASIRGMEIANRLVAVENWGLKQGYLSEGYVSSDYFKDIASGPLSVIIINLAMVLPFAFSAVVETIYARNKAEDDDKASQAGLWLMVIGFITLCIGLIMIGVIFFNTNVTNT